MVPTINHWLGQPEVIARFRIALEAAWNDARPLPHMLMVGPPGVGKTELAHLAAREMGVNLHERLAQTLMSPGAVNSLLLDAQDRDIVFIDEVHELLPLFQTTLYRAMEDRQVFVRGRDNKTMAMPLNNITVCAATTDMYSLLPPLRDRFKVILPFSFYDMESLAQIAAQQAAQMEIAITPEIAQAVAARSRGTPRLSIRILEACHRYARSKGETEVTQKHFAATIGLEGLDELGLGPDEQRYIRYLAKKQDPVRLTTLESALGVHRKTLQTVIEPFLVRANLIERSDKGRCLTEEGLRHLKLVDGAESPQA